MKETENDTNKYLCGNSPVSWIGKINVVNMAILLKAINRIQCAPSQISNGIFQRQQAILKFVYNNKTSQIVKAILRKNKARGITPPDFIL